MDVKKYDELLNIIGDHRFPDAQRMRARAQVDVALAQDNETLLLEIQKGVREAIAALGSQVEAASASSERTSRSIVSWTKVLAFATVVLAVATVALVVVTWRLVPAAG